MYANKSEEEQSFNGATCKMTWKSMRARRIWFRALLHGNSSVTQEMWDAVEEYTMTGI